MKKNTIKLWAGLIALLLWGTAQAGTVTYVYSDPQGTPLAEADANGNITATFDYRPYGAQALGQPPSGPGYTGHVNDPEIGLVYMQARYYDPEVGRFLSVDPVESGAGNRYTYVSNNPIGYVDPDGRLGETSDHNSDPCDIECKRLRQQERQRHNDGPWTGGGVHSAGSVVQISGEDTAQENGPWAAAGISSGVLIADDSTGVGVVDDVAIPVILVGAAAIDLNTRVFVTYMLSNSMGQTYVGRASGFGTPTAVMMRRFASHHMALSGFGSPTLDAWAKGAGAYAAIRGREQQLMDRYGGVGSPGLANRIRGVARWNPAGRLLWGASNAKFGPLSPYTGR